MVWMPRLFLPPLPYAKLYLRNPSASLLREANQFLPYGTRVSPLVALTVSSKSIEKGANPVRFAPN